MAKILPANLAPDALPRVRGSLLTRISRGVIIAQKWPRKRGPVTNSNVNYTSRQFSFAAKMAANPEPMSYATAVFMVKGSHWMPRDLLVMAAYGKAYEITLPEGGVATQAFHGPPLLAGTLADLTDCQIVSPAAGDQLIFDGTKWANVPFRGALVKKSADLTGQNFTTAAAVAWNTESYDEGGFHDNVTSNTRLTIPTGVTKIALAASINYASLTADQYVFLGFRKNGSNSYDGSASQYTEAGVTTGFSTLSSPILNVTPGDYFELFYQVESDTSSDILAARSWFACAAVQ